MGMHNKPRCKSLDPDCLNCPFEDCIANQHDIMRQIAFQDKQEFEKRNTEIYKLYESGMTPSELGKRYGVSPQHIGKIVRKIRRKEQC